MEAQSWSQGLKIVAETRGHPSCCRWTAGKRTSSRDAGDIFFGFGAATSRQLSVLVAGTVRFVRK